MLPHDCPMTSATNLVIKAQFRDRSSTLSSVASRSASSSELSRPQTLLQAIILQDRTEFRAEALQMPTITKSPFGLHNHPGAIRLCRTEIRKEALQIRTYGSAGTIECPANLRHRRSLVILIIRGMIFQEMSLNTPEVQPSHAQSRQLGDGTQRLAVRVNRPLHRENGSGVPKAWATGTMTLCETCHR